MAMIRKMVAILMILLVMAAIPAMAEEKLPQVNTELLVLANSAEPMGEEDTPTDLVKLVSRRAGASTKGTVYTTSATSVQLRAEAADALVAMCAAAEKKDITLYVRQGYRSYADEATRYARLEKRGEAAQKPGETDYQTGLAVTVVGKDWKSKTLTAEFADSKEGKWLIQNAAAYGFVLRYPQNKVTETGWEYEPWHLRYVGVEAAAYMQAHDLCLEEFVGLVKLGGFEEIAAQTQEPEVVPAEDASVETTEPASDPEAVSEENAEELTETPAPTQIPEYEPGQLVELEDVGPDGDHELSFFHE